MCPIPAFAVANTKHGLLWKFECVTFFRGQFKTWQQVAANGITKKVEYESETSVINYTSDSNDTSFEASTTDLLIIKSHLRRRCDLLT